MVASRTGRHTTLVAVVVAFAVMCAAVSAALHTAAADADKTCTSHQDGGDTVAVDFDVVLAWSATASAANHARSRFQPRAWAAASHARRLEALREAVKPSAARIARVLDFIGRDILAFCDTHQGNTAFDRPSILFDTIPCRNVPLALLRTSPLTGNGSNPLCRDPATNAVMLMHPAKSSRSRWPASAQNDIELLLGLEPSPNGERFRRPHRHRQNLRERRRAMAELRSRSRRRGSMRRTTNSDGHDIRAPMPRRRRRQAVGNALPASAWSIGASPAPLIVGVYTASDAPYVISSVMVALNCADGAPTDGGYQGTKGYHSWCNNDGAKETRSTVVATPSTNVLPVTLYVVDVLTGANVSLGLEAAAADTTCESDWLPSANAPAAERKVVVCEVNVTSLFEKSAPARTTWALSRLNATVVFEDGRAFAAEWHGYYSGKPNPIAIGYPTVVTVQPSDARRQYRAPVVSVPKSNSSHVNGSSVTVGVLEFTDNSDLPYGDMGIKLSDLVQFMNMDRQLTGEPLVTEAELRDELVRFIGNRTTVPTDETSLDIQWILALSNPGTKLVLWNVENGPGAESKTYQEAFVRWSQKVIAPDGPVSGADAPSVYSISYCGPEWNDAHQTVLNRNLELMSAAGITTLAAAGDWGAVWTLRPDEAKERAYALFPASSPHVVAVGGSAPVAAKVTDDIHVEVACMSNYGNEITTGGGFSTSFDVPAYQEAQVAAYAAKAAARGGTWPPYAQGPVNASRRAVPDVAALATQLQTVEDGTVYASFGTSGAAPMMAAFVGQAVAARRHCYHHQHGGSAGEEEEEAAIGLPHFHALLYAGATASSSRSSLESPLVLQDLTSGDNCAGEQYGAWAANVPDLRPHCYAATTGWDAVSGLGTLNVTRLCELAAAWPGTV